VSPENDLKTFIFIPIQWYMPELLSFSFFYLKTLNTRNIYVYVLRTNNDDGWMECLILSR